MFTTELPGSSFGGFRAAGRAEPLTREELIASYTVADRSQPWLRANFVSSLDGAVTRDGVSEGLGTEPDHIVFELLRMLSDVVIVGAGTVRAEGYTGSLVSAQTSAWRTTNGLSAHPPLAVVSSRLNLDPASAVFADAPVRPIVITHESAPQSIRHRLGEVADVIVAGTSRVDLAEALAELAGRGFSQMLNEGGPRLLGSLLDAGVVDELCLTLAPTLEGGDAGRVAQGAMARPHAMRLAHAITAGDTVLLRQLRQLR